MLFNEAHRESKKAANPSLNCKEVNALLAKDWAELSASDKNFWEDKSNEERDRWQIENNEYQKVANLLEENFNNTALVQVLGKCFDKDELDQFVSKCLAKDIVGFALLEKTKSKTKKERLKLLSVCRPAECTTAADLFRYLIQVVYLSILLEYIFYIFSAEVTDFICVIFSCRIIW